MILESSSHPWLQLWHRFVLWWPRYNWLYNKPEETFHAIHSTLYHSYICLYITSRIFDQVHYVITWQFSFAGTLFSFPFPLKLHSILVLSTNFIHIFILTIIPFLFSSIYIISCANNMHFVVFLGPYSLVFLHILLFFLHF